MRVSVVWTAVTALGGVCWGAEPVVDPDRARPAGEDRDTGAAEIAPQTTEPSSREGVPPFPEDRELLEEIEAATEQTKSGEGAAAQGFPTSGASSPEPGRSTAGPTPRTGGLYPNIYNPALSVNGLFLAAATSWRDPPSEALRTALAVQELELQFIAAVDPYFTANLIFAVPGGEGFELEEGFVIPSATPLGVQARLGKMKLSFGRENALHLHALPFVDKSLAGAAILGDEGLNEVGAELSRLLPVGWYALVTAGVFDGGNERLFAGADPENAMGFAALQNVFDLDDDTTLELGAAYGGGRNAARELAHVVGAHLVLKWRPARRAREREALVVIEGLFAARPNAEALPASRTASAAGLGGGYAYAQWRLGRRWYVGARVDAIAYPAAVDPATTNGDEPRLDRRGSFLLAFVPTEFSAVRAQLNAGRALDSGDRVYEGMLQLDITIGAHPAHSY